MCDAAVGKDGSGAGGADRAEEVHVLGRMKKTGKLFC